MKNLMTYGIEVEKSTLGKADSLSPRLGVLLKLIQ